MLCSERDFFSFSGIILICTSYTGFQVLTVVSIHVTVLWVVTLCIEMDSSFLEELLLAIRWTLKWKQQIQYTAHSLTTQKTTLWICTLLIPMTYSYLKFWLSESLDASILFNLNCFVSALQLGERGIVNVARFGTKMAMLWAILITQQHSYRPHRQGYHTSPLQWWWMSTRCLCQSQWHSLTITTILCLYTQGHLACQQYVLLAPTLLASYMDFMLALSFHRPAK